VTRHEDTRLLVVKDLRKNFAARSSSLLSWHSSFVQAVAGVSFELRRGEILGLVGESGSGKSTVGRTVLRLLEPTSGSVIFDGKDVMKADRKELRALRRQMQIIFQDPFSSLDPRKTVGALVGEALDVHRIAAVAERRDRTASLLSKVGLSHDHMRRYPHEFSGGQRQRIGIARALAVEPSFIVADEAVSALDVSVQAQVINLISDLQEELGISLLFISHDLGVVEFIADRVMVLYLGRVMEIGPVRAIYSVPRHPYTAALLSATPTLDKGRSPRRIHLKGEIPSPLNPPSGCVFRTRCPLAIDACAAAAPPLAPVGPDHVSACIRQDAM